MTADSQLALQASVLTALRSTGALTALLGNGSNGVLDHVPENTAYPYVVIGESRGRPFDTKTEQGMEQTLTIHSWSRYRGMKELKEIMAAVVAALDRQSLSIVGHSLVLLQFESSETQLDRDGLTRHGLQRFRALTEAN